MMRPEDIRPTIRQRDSREGAGEADRSAMSRPNSRGAAEKRRQHAMAVEAVESLAWSDEEEADKYVLKLPKSPFVDHDDESTVTAATANISIDNEQGSLIFHDRLADHRRSKFNGYIKVDRVKRADVKAQQRSPPKRKDYPSVPGNVELNLGVEALNLLWAQFLICGADEAELITVADARRLGQAPTLAPLRLPFDKLSLRRDKDDYVDFQMVCATLARHCTAPRAPPKEPPQCRVCCASTACRHQRGDARELMDTATVGGAQIATAVRLARLAQGGGGEGDEGDDGDGAESKGGPEEEEEEEGGGPAFVFETNDETRLKMVYNSVKLQVGGRLRLRHVDWLMHDLGVPFDKQKLPRRFWEAQGELLIMDISDLALLVEALRTEEKEAVDPLAAMFKYDLPAWLREEFKASEIMLYEHHFQLIDADGGGSIDVDELKALVESFGGKISQEDAQAMLDEFDMDGGGTIDFLEFMVLVYKIQRGTIDLSSSELAQALVEAKAQLQIFEEIEEVSRYPPPLCSVGHFGGSPVNCQFHVQGPPGTPYEGSEVVVEMVFQDGYPFRQPDIQIMGRVLGLNFLPQLSGNTRMMHIKQVWTAEWSMKRLLEHTVQLLQCPDPDLLPDSLFDIYAAWGEQLRTLLDRQMHRLLQGVVRERLTREAEVARLKAEAARLAVERALREVELARMAGELVLMAAEDVAGEAEGKEEKEQKEQKEEKGGEKGESVRGGSVWSLESGDKGDWEADSKSTLTFDEGGNKDRADSKSGPSQEADSKDGVGGNPSPRASAKHSAPTSSRGEKAEWKEAEAEAAEPVDEVPTELLRRERSLLLASLSMEQLSDERTLRRVDLLPRIERMHLGTMLNFLLSDHQVPPLPTDCLPLFPDSASLASTDSYSASVHAFMQQHPRTGHSAGDP